MQVRKFRIMKERHRNKKNIISTGPVTTLLAFDILNAFDIWTLFRTIITIARNIILALNILGGS